jgi:hypothetical protein
LEEIAEAEQLKVTAALLFQAICEYPRVTEQFYENPNAQNAIGMNLNGLFQAGSRTDVNFAESIRFRNWMRYGVSPQLLAASYIPSDAMAPQPFQGPVNAITNGSIAQIITVPSPAGGGGLLNQMTFLPWNKISSNSNTGVLNRGLNNAAPQNYSAFDITRGARSANLYPNVPGTIALPGGGVPNPNYPFLGVNSC